MTSATIHFKKLTTEQRDCCLSYCPKSHVSQFYIKCLMCPLCCWATHPRRRRHWPMARSTKRCGTLSHSVTMVFLANWLSWIINIDRPSVEGHPEQHNQLNLSLGATCQAWSTLITQPVSGVAGLSASSDISRGSVATHLRCGGICSDSFIKNCLVILTVKEF